MPRGLGDNPLKRTRARRVSPQVAGTEQTSEGQPVAGPVEETIAPPQAWHDSATRRSYNEVFFQRKPDGAAPPATLEVAQSSAAHEAVDVAPPAPEMSVAPLETVPQAPLISPTSDAVPAHVEIPPTAVVQEPAPAPQTDVHVPEPVSATAEVAPSDVEVHAAAPQASEQKTGFFGRIFGKFKKS